jgi:hypothetical protein
MSDLVSAEEISNPLSPVVTRSRSRASSVGSNRSRAGSSRDTAPSPNLITQTVSSDLQDKKEKKGKETEESENDENLESEDENSDGEDSNNGEDDDERENGESEEEEDQQPTTGEEVDQQKAGEKVDQQEAGENVVTEEVGVEGEGEEVGVEGEGEEREGASNSEVNGKSSSGENSTTPIMTSSSCPASPKLIVLRGKSFSRVDGPNIPPQIRTTIVQKRKLDTTPVNPSDNKRLIHFTAPMVLYHSNRVMRLAQDGLTLGSGEPNDVTNSREVTAEQVVLQLSAGK